MKNLWKSALVVFALTAFTACGGSDNTTETETTEQTDTQLDRNTDMDMETDTTTVQDTTVNDGVVDEMPPGQQ
ncbi:hypothetical protein [Pontibacter burrus]|uniref:Uncharacterized protein n=1 Tax=Pontibacter burrus TaxID=2704466 RepID=A0A6B3M0T6_9BACT|nr:hypothetical protein [Pontibacter burrus]NEM99464.1 hypothetical protein [Pontibacter burrus]